MANLKPMGHQIAGDTAAGHQINLTAWIECFDFSQQRSDKDGITQAMVRTTYQYAMNACRR